MSCVPWQSVQVAATALPPLRATPCTVPAYSLTAFSWQVAQLTGFSFSGCGSLSAETSAWQSVHFSLSSPCTDATNFAPSTAIDLPPAPLASAAAWHMRQVSFGFGGAAGLPPGLLPARTAAAPRQNTTHRAWIIRSGENHPISLLWTRAHTARRDPPFGGSGARPMANGVTRPSPAVLTCVNPRRSVPGFGPSLCPGGAQAPDNGGSTVQSPRTRPSRTSAV